MVTIAQDARQNLNFSTLPPNPYELSVPKTTIMKGVPTEHQQPKKRATEWEALLPVSNMPQRAEAQVWDRICKQKLPSASTQSGILFQPTVRLGFEEEE